MLLINKSASVEEYVHKEGKGGEGGRSSRHNPGSFAFEGNPLNVLGRMWEQQQG